MTSHDGARTQPSPDQPDRRRSTFVLQELGRYKTLIGLIIVEVASRLPFAVLIMRAFVASIPRQFVAVLTSGSAKGRSEAVREWTHRGDLERG